MRWYRAFRMSDDGTTVTIKDGVRFAAGTSTSPNTLLTGERGTNNYYTTAATTGAVYARYHSITTTAAGGYPLAGRDRVILGAIAPNAVGNHSTVEVTSTGYATGLCAGIRGNIVFATDTVVPFGTYYGVMAEIYAIGNTGALPTSNACLAINCNPGTAIDLVANAISFSGTDGAGKMIYTHAPTTLEGSVKILINGVVKHLPYYTTE